MFQVGEGGPQAPSTPPPPGQGSAQGPGEFTRMFQAVPQQAFGEAPPPVNLSSPCTSAKKTAPPPTGKTQAPGEFTQMFSTSPKQPAGETPLSAGGAPASAPPPFKQGPGHDQPAGEFYENVLSLRIAAPNRLCLWPNRRNHPCRNRTRSLLPPAPLPAPMVQPPPGGPSPFGQQSPSSPFGQQPSSPFGQQARSWRSTGIRSNSATALWRSGPARL